MAEIRILPEHVVNQIAAGEVVERASAVLKELVENALDAGSSQIHALIQDHGRSLIQVVDDGCGMSRQDLQLAFERHATSKLARPEDLYAIRTFGFRGEALPSIASVSVVEVRSTLAGAASGTLLRLEAGSIVHEEPVAGTRGTSVAVHSLFYNTPARARFLKSSATEFAHLVRVFKQYALACPDLAWTFAHGGTEHYNLPSGSAPERLAGIFGAGIAAKCSELDYEMPGLRISGFVGSAELIKKSRGDQYIFLNRRPIHSALVHAAVRAAAKELLDGVGWPFYVVFVESDPAQVDVNVHPAKTEVKFADEQRIHAAVYRAVRTALPQQLRREIALPAATAGPPATGHTGPDTLFSASPASASRDLPAERFTSGLHREHDAASDVPLLRPAIFQAHNKYLISPVRSGLAIIDQHAAHERILYERAQRSFAERTFASQQLLFPWLLELDVEPDAVFRELRADLCALGFEFRDFGERVYSVEAVPAGLRRASETSLIQAMLEEYVEFRRADFAARDALAASFACHTAIRAGDPLTPDEMASLVDELFATQFPLTCPHGRPTVVHVTLAELDRRFKRTE